MKVTIKKYLSEVKIYENDIFTNEELNDICDKYKTDVDIIFSNINKDCTINITSTYVQKIHISNSYCNKLRIIGISNKHTNLSIYNSYVNNLLVDKINKFLLDFTYIKDCYINNINILGIYNSHIILKLHDVIDRVEIELSRISLDGNSFINTLDIIGSSIGGGPEFNVNKLNISRTVITSPGFFNFLKTKNRYLESTNMDFKVEDPITIYKKVYRRTSSIFDGHHTAVLKGHTFKDSLINKGITGKYRTNHCIFTEAYDWDGQLLDPSESEFTSLNYSDFIYTLNKEIIIDDFDTKLIECSTGIHFFLTFNDAVDY